MILTFLMNGLEWTQFIFFWLGLLFGLLFTEKGFFVRLFLYRRVFKYCCCRPTYWFFKENKSDNKLHLKKLFPVNDKYNDIELGLEEEWVYGKTKSNKENESYTYLKFFNQQYGSAFSNDEEIFNEIIKKFKNNKFKGIAKYLKTMNDEINVDINHLREYNNFLEITFIDKLLEELSQFDVINSWEYHYKDLWERLFNNYKKILETAMKNEEYKNVMKNTNYSSKYQQLTETLERSYKNKKNQLRNSLDMVNNINTINKKESQLYKWRSK